MEPHPFYIEAFRDARVLVTGGAGFIGSHLAWRLVELGADVHVIDDLSGGFRDNVHPEAELIVASILEEKALRSALEDCRFVFHEAALVSVPESVEHPRRCAEINIFGTELVLEEALRAGVQRVIFAASAAAYGGEPELPSRENHPTDCRSPYAASKVAGEALLRAFGTCTPLSTISLRYFNIFGPRQNPDSPYAAAISAFARALGKGKPPTIYGDGKQTRDFTFIDNVVHANLLAAASPRDFRGEIVNVGTARQISLLDVLNEMGRILNVRVEPQFGDPRAGDVRDSVADIARARELLGYEPIVDFAEGLRRTLLA